MKVLILHDSRCSVNGDAYDSEVDYKSDIENRILELLDIDKSMGRIVTLIVRCTF